MTAPDPITMATAFAAAAMGAFIVARTGRTTAPRVAPPRAPSALDAANTWPSPYAVCPVPECAHPAHAHLRIGGCTYGDELQPCMCDRSYGPNA